MKTAVSLSLCWSLLAAAAPAATEGYSVQSAAVQLALPNSGPRGVKDYRVGEAILELPLLWSAAATLREPATIEADGKSQQLDAGSVLPRQLLAARGTTPIAAYCTPRQAAERSAERGALGILLGGGSLWRKAIRSATDRQACLIDTDADGRADHSVIVGDGSPEARTPRPISPLALQVAELVPISGQDRLRIKLLRVSPKAGFAEFEIDIVQQGKERVFDVIGGPWGSASRVTRVDFKASGPAPVSMLGADFSLVALDGAERRARIEWLEGVERDRPVIIPDALHVVMSPY
jgi:hypothetical protein